MEVTCPSCRHVVELRPDRPTKCGNCGAMLPPPADPAESGNGTPAGATTRPPFAVPPAPPASTRPASIIAFVFGAIVFVPVVTQLVAIVVGLTAVARRRRPDERVGLAWAGLILGAFALACWLAFLGPIMQRFYSAIAVGRTGFLMPPAGGGVPENDWERTAALADEMRRVYSAASAYRRDFGRWPDSVDRLAGRWLPLGYSLPKELTYRPAPTTAETRSGWALMVSDAVRVGLEGNRLDRSHRLVLRLDGGIELATSEDVQALLDRTPRPPEPDP